MTNIDDQLTKHHSTQHMLDADDGGGEMYEKPEVTKYSGSELLDLMGPVETGYCDLGGEQGVTDRDCYIEYTIQLTEGKNVDDFDGLDFELTGPCGGETGRCVEGDEDNCILVGDAVPAPPTPPTSWDFRIDICSVCPSSDTTGNWTLELELVDDGKSVQGCESGDSFNDPR